MITQQRLRDVLSFDQETGVFTWRNSNPPVRAGTHAGSLKKSGYVIIQIDGKFYRAHRLAWLFVHGSFPVGMLDHKDRCRSNNAITNLRESDNSRNIANAKVRTDSKCGVKGVRWINGKWSARIEIAGRQKYLGKFDTKEKAGAAFLEAAKERYGEFAVTI